MDDNELQILKELILEQHVLSLSVIIEDAPYAGMLPFAVFDDFSALLVHASSLAKHTTGLSQGSKYSAVIHKPDIPGIDPLQLPRFMITGQSKPLDKQDASYQVASATYQKKFPNSKMIFSLSDFNLYALQIEKGRLITGFGRAFNITIERLKELSQS